MWFALQVTGRKQFVIAGAKEIPVLHAKDLAGFDHSLVPFVFHVFVVFVVVQ